MRVRAHCLYRHLKKASPIHGPREVCNLIPWGREPRNNLLGVPFPKLII